MDAKDSRANLEDGSLTKAHEVNTGNNNEYNIYAGLATLRYAPGKSMSFTFGANVSFVENDMHSRTTDDGTESNLSGLHSEEIKYALFAEGTRSWETFSASLGLRYEMFKMTYTDKQAQSVLEDRTYNRLYPYISYSYSGKNVKMGLALFIKVKRPSYYQLRNSTEYLNRYAMEMGDPLLLPQYTTGLSYTAKYRDLTFSMDYQWISDYIMSSNIITQSDPLVSVSKPVNLPHYTALNAGLSYNTKIGVWEPYLSANLMRTFLDICNEDGTRANGMHPYMAASFNNYWKLKGNWMPYLLIPATPLHGFHPNRHWTYPVPCGICQADESTQISPPARLAPFTIMMIDGTVGRHLAIG